MNTNFNASTIDSLQPASPAMTTTRSIPHDLPSACNASDVGLLQRIREFAVLVLLLSAGCGPSFDPASLIDSTRVLGARVEVAGASGRASPAPGESATVTWFVTAKTTVPSLAWAFALCAPGGASARACGSTPFAVFQGTTNPPSVSLTVPSTEALAGADRLVLYGRICTDSAPLFDPQTGDPGCSAGGTGTTALLTIQLQTGADTNHNPTAERSFTLDGQAWPLLPAGADPCASGPRVVASDLDHVIGLVADGTDRESYQTVQGDPPAPTLARESLQISSFATAGKLSAQYLFVEAADERSETSLAVKWSTPKAADVAGEAPVTFFFVVRDNRGGADWTSRSACVVPAR